MNWLILNKMNGAGARLLGATSTICGQLSSGLLSENALKFWPAQPHVFFRVHFRRRVIRFQCCSGSLARGARRTLTKRASNNEHTQREVHHDPEKTT